MPGLTAMRAIVLPVAGVALDKPVCNLGQVDGALAEYRAVYESEPDNETARLEKQKALRLKDKVKALPG